MVCGRKNGGAHILRSATCTCRAPRYLAAAWQPVSGRRREALAQNATSVVEQWQGFGH